MTKQSSAQKTRSEIDQFVGTYMENVDVKNGKALPFKTTSNGNCFFHSILYHVGRGNLKATHHDLKELREGAFDAIKNMNLPQNIEINGLTKGKFDKKYKEIQKSEGVSHYHYADVLSVSSMANQYEKHIIILDDSGFVQIVPTESEAMSDTLTNEPEGNYYVIRRENGNHYRPYIYREKGTPQLFTDVVIDILNRKINDTDMVVLNGIETGTGVRQYSITWEDLTSLLDIPFEYVDKSSNKSSNKSSITLKKNKKRVDDLIKLISQIKSGTKTTANNKTRTITKTTANNKTRSITKTTANNKTRKRKKVKNRTIGELPDVEYCLIGCDNHILVLLYDVLIAFIERLGLK